MVSVRARRPSAAAACLPAAARRAARSCRHNQPDGRDHGELVIETLKKRGEFLAVRGGIRVSRRAFLVEAKASKDPHAHPPRFGFTVTKKLGNAVRRNLIRRRLKHAVQLAAASSDPPNLDFVVVARNAAADMVFAALVADMTGAISEIAKRHRQTVTAAEMSSSGPQAGRRPRHSA